MCLDSITLILFGKYFELRILPSCNFLRRPNEPYVLDLHILLSNFYLDTFNLCSSTKMRDQALQTHKTTGKIILHHILIVRTLDRKRKSKGLLSWMVTNIPEMKSALVLVKLLHSETQRWGLSLFSFARDWKSERDVFLGEQKTSPLQQASNNCSLLEGLWCKWIRDFTGKMKCFL
jgi:hypothetical protein